MSNEERFQREPEHDKRAAQGDGNEANAWRDGKTGELLFVDPDWNPNTLKYEYEPKQPSPAEGKKISNDQASLPSFDSGEIAVVSRNQQKPKKDGLLPVRRPRPFLAISVVGGGILIALPMLLVLLIRIDACGEVELIPYFLLGTGIGMVGMGIAASLGVALGTAVAWILTRLGQDSDGVAVLLFESFAAVFAALAGLLVLLSGSGLISAMVFFPDCL